ncbi:hypothetical protein TIFTF001_007308 [Ficus carica]|uniref:Stress-related protein n=1 Tax=Ficus carica TaxID=3494 RepID=A0AA88AD45_FICCA|nr:hypothetical protein TIFTF001_007308 [Ficus carica]
MADSEVQQPTTETVQPQENHGEEKILKHLEFVQVAAIYIVVCFSTVYEYAKENSGPLKPGVQTVEDTVKTVIGPVYEKFHDVPFQFLKFVDCKVDEVLSDLDGHVPLLVRQGSSQAVAAARAVAAEVQSSGVVGATRVVYARYEPAAKELIEKYEPEAEQYAVAAWRGLNRLPLFQQVAQIAVPTAAYWAERYNEGVACAVERGYAVGSYLPLIPVERIAKVFDEGESGPPVPPNGDAHVVAQ